MEIIESFISSVKNRVPAVTAVDCFKNEEIDGTMYSDILNASQNLPLEEKMRVFSYASIVSTGEIHELFEKKSFSCVREMVIDGTVTNSFSDFTPNIRQEKVEVNLPLRINWGGTWTDTPPYCLENGGAVVNAAININGVPPVHVVLEKVAGPRVILEYSDSGYRREYENINELSNLSDPLDPFILLKSSLAVCGLIQISGLKPSPDIFKILHGGIYLSAGVVGIPKGSGLGTSSILLAACVKGISDFIGCELTQAELYRRVLLAEQMMNTGGGWQDQAGGLTEGIKLIFSGPGYKQEIKCDVLMAPKAFLLELNTRFCLVYSGQRRVGKTILREIMGGYIRSDPVFLDALSEIYSLAIKMKDNIESGNTKDFIDNLNSQTDITCKLDTGYINERIKSIFDVCADMTAGKMICGAGGGGFIQFILKEGVSKKDLSNRLQTCFPNQDIDVWRCDFV